MAIFSSSAKIEQVHHRAAAALAAKLRQVVHLLPIDLAAVGEEQQVVVRAGDEQVLDRIFFVGLGALQALAAAALGPIDAGRRALDVAVVADRDDHRLFGDQVLQVDRADLLAADLGAPLVGVLPLQLQAVVADDGQDVLFVGENPLVLGDLVEQLVILAGQLFLLQVDQLAQRHPQDGVGLHRRERVGVAHAALALENGKACRRPAPAASAPPALRRPSSGLWLRAASCDERMTRMISSMLAMRQQQAFDRVLALPRLGQQELRAAANHDRAMADELLAAAP